MRTFHARPRMGLTRPVLASALAVLLLSGCGDRSGPRPQAEVWDSAGVRIVENPAIEELEALPWVLSAEPILDIGALEGSLESQLFRVRDALRLEDGRLLILDGGSNEVRVFDQAGRFVESWGGAGEGPGEFVGARLLLRWAQDSIAVWDSRQQRLTRFGLDGGLGPATGIPEGEAMDRPDVVGLTQGGDLILSTLRVPEALESGYVRIPTRISVVDRTGSEAADLGIHPGDEAVMRVGEGTINILRMPITRTVVVTPVSDEIMIAGTERLSFDYFDANHEFGGIVRFPYTPRLITDADREAALERSLSRMPEGARGGMRAIADDLFPVDTFPAFSTMVNDVTDHQWVQLYRAPWDPGPDLWLVTDPAGIALGLIELPQGFTVYEIGTDYVLGHTTDELDVEHVQLWGLER